MKKLGLTLVTLLAIFGSTQAQKPAVVSTNNEGWQHIGQTSASFKTQNESIEVLGADEFTAIKLKVSEAPLHIERLQVFYESGDMEEINVRSDMKAGSESRVIKLKHPDRDIDKVAFTYKTTENTAGEKADVALYGLKTGQPSGADSYRDEKEAMKQDVKETKEDVKREANETAEEADRKAQSAGDKISEGVNDAAAAIKDEKIKDKVGPGGETVYVNEAGKYYYINNEGNKVFITELQLKDPDN
ncbi:hypothetical protein [Chryseolinea sp. H1M3-3]|uniref:hypothetical protein n=1 Tax=Chryseolinea sp. H1M3-3 TaxID=3034144 RepID=UPI0023EDD7E4|nr:hypothetical protein [Chryseolinea sp. H1M3-3]